MGSAVQVTSMKKILPVSLTLLLLWNHGVAQEPSGLDTLLMVWQDEGKTDSARVAAYYSYVQGYLHSSPDSAIVLADALEQFGEQRQYPKAIAVAWLIRAKAEEARNHYMEALAHYRKSITFHEQAGARRGLANCHISMGSLFSEMGDYMRAFAAFEEGRAIAEEIGVPEMLGSLYGNLANLNLKLGNSARALDYYARCMEIFKGMGRKREVALTHMNAGVAYHDTDPERAMAEYRQAYELGVELGDSAVLAGSLTNIGNIHWDREELTEALEHFQRAERIRVEMGDEGNLCLSLVNIGNTYNKMGDNRQAVVYCQKALQIAERYHILEYQKKGCGCLYRAYKALGMDREALAHMEKERVLDDSLRFRESIQQLEQMEFRKQLTADSLRTEEEKRLLQGQAASQLRSERMRRFGFMGGGAGALILAVVLWRRLGRTRREKAQSEEILHSVLPEEIAREIRETGQARNRNIEQVSVLFTDFQGFTELSAQISQQELTDEITACFTAFDGILSLYQVDKIKTIGDAYLAASGLKAEAPDAAVRALRAALEMQAFVEARHNERTAHGLPAFRMRVGIHTGPVVAGIVGVKKFQYDIWGDTVNMASRMESSGEVGKVNISEATYSIVKDEAGFTFISRGMVEAKGKGAVQMWFVEGAGGQWVDGLLPME
jgi:adenylate cyclase